MQIRYELNATREERETEINKIIKESGAERRLCLTYVTVFIVLFLLTVWTMLYQPQNPVMIFGTTFAPDAPKTIFLAIVTTITIAKFATTSFAMAVILDGLREFHYNGKLHDEKRQRRFNKQFAKIMDAADKTGKSTSAVMLYMYVNRKFTHDTRKCTFTWISGDCTFHQIKSNDIVPTKLKHVTPETK